MTILWGYCVVRGGSVKKKNYMSPLSTDYKVLHYSCLKLSKHSICKPKQTDWTLAGTRHCNLAVWKEFLWYDQCCLSRTVSFNSYYPSPLPTPTPPPHTPRQHRIITQSNHFPLPPHSFWHLPSTCLPLPLVFGRSLSCPPPVVPFERWVGERNLTPACLPFFRWSLHRTFHFQVQYQKL